VVATDWDGYPETLPPEYAPRLIPTVASHELAKSIHWTASSQACAPTYHRVTAELARLTADAGLRERIGAWGLGFVEQRTWTPAGAALVGLLGRLVAEERAGRSEEPAPAHSAPPTSMVDGLASAYLDDDPALRLGTVQNGWRRRAALRMIQRGTPPRYGGAAHGGAAARRRRTVLAAAAEQRDGVRATELRHRSGLDVAEADWLLLQLIRYGELDVTLPETASHSKRD
jgi:hypothetical protein